VFVCEVIKSLASNWNEQRVCIRDLLPFIMSYVSSLKVEEQKVQAGARSAAAVTELASTQEKLRSLELEQEELRAQVA